MQNPINQYLENPFIWDDVDVSDIIPPRSISFTDEDVAKINKIGLEFGLGEAVQKRTEPKQPKKLSKGQIWTVKDTYTDALGNTLRCYPFIVMIVNGPWNHFGAKMIRVVTITEFIEMRCEDDLIVTDQSILGFPFMIQMWNEHIMSAEILETYCHKYDYKNHKQPSYRKMKDYMYYSYEDIKEFRHLTMRNSSYLTNSAWSHIPQ